ncbi:oxidized purine nucleoside triphosphate hydrolase-like [Lycorma delicatula]|uniref:oxidized purine nucleoside triphosphate hydrolase-like n=1 Tax=Lycorma delicatula TaxID=130591 RepID=UPI003F5193F3
MHQRKVLTLVFIRNGRDILLGYKKRGFGKGKWNGFGGKLEEGETLEEAAKREVKEECGLTVEKLDKVGVIDFEFKGDPVILNVHVFMTDQFSGSVVESEEMQPQWFSERDIPFNSMWADDKHWLPSILLEKKIKAFFLFEDHDTILNYNIDFVNEVP